MTQQPPNEDASREPDNVSNQFLARLNQKRQEEAERAAVQQPASLPHQRNTPAGFDPALLAQFQDDIVDLGDVTSGSFSAKETVLDDFIKNLSIVEAYMRWTPKQQVPISTRKEIKVRCPNPEHEDKEKSCSLNTQRNVFMCFLCGGGDVWHIAAWGLGYPVPGYQRDPQMFRNLRADIGLAFGMEVSRAVGIGGQDIPELPMAPMPIYPPVTDQPQLPPPPPGVAVVPPQDVVYTAEGSGYVEAMDEYDSAVLAKRVYPGIDWRNLVPENTFLREYLNVTTVDDCPEEFHFWSGLIALGMATGRARTLEDSPEVVPNLFVCFTAGTGAGKSKAKRHLIELVKQALPYKPTDQPPHGARVIKGSQSGEHLIKSFVHPIVDPTDGKTIGYYPNIKGLVEFAELSEMIGKAKRQGSTLKPVVMDLYDAPHTLSSGSLTHGDMEAEQPFGSVLTTTQIKAIRELLSRADDASGFANRWVYAMGIEKPQFAINRVAVDLTRAGGLLKLINMDCKSHSLVTWSPEAETRWTQFFHEYVVPFKKNNPDAEIAQRIDLLLKKLFLLWTINLKSKVVELSSVEAVLSLYPHLLESYQIIDEQISASREGDDQDLIVRTITRMSSAMRGPTAREIHQAVRRRIPQVRILRKVLEDLVMLGILEEFKLPAGPRGGRPSTCFMLASNRHPAFPYIPQPQMGPPQTMQQPIPTGPISGGPGDS